MKTNLHFWVLVVGTIVFMSLIYVFVPFPSVGVGFAPLSDSNGQLLEKTNQVMLASMQNGYILSIAIKIVSTYIGFVILVFGHNKLSKKQVAIAG